ncbi:uncharacterized protein J7T54_001001 [Emericellopsis cladophorae]|uniref:FAD-binding FR-type domain-containing protein n=1 Tax=Emericellopsis cladophorae TaxID=2686198 RepID=A0A9Q0BC21_9HYPO|nr:uncharacterized protein J7T54_001001 [Emericellopsis cladophorae]KAI6779271.1 hypothetical protein J7T54_001001 [Emericellopsis cladophorae]
MHRLLHVPQSDDPTAMGLPPHYASRVRASPLVALGALDHQGRPWSTVWGGERGFAQKVAEDVVALNSVVDRRWDPVFEALWDGQDGESEAVVQGNGRSMSGLSIDLETRDRVKLAGRMVAGAVAKDQNETRVQMAMAVEGSLGNCPKYLNKKAVTPHHLDDAELLSSTLPLHPQAVDLLTRADLFFVSSTNGESLDTNHRGGPPGFVRILKNQEGEVVLVYPEYSGNRLYQTLGNLKVNPLVGVVVPDFDTGNVLYLTGSTTILVGEQATSLIARTKLAVKISVTDVRFVKAGLPFRASFIDYSPYNPPVRQLLTEQPSHVSSASHSTVATLIDRVALTPTISRFTFDISLPEKEAETNEPLWQAGQHVTLDFYDRLSYGYAHMNNADPQSLNDDYVRTFTVSNAPGKNQRRQQIEITAKKHGPATGLMWRHPLAHAHQIPLEIPVMGFGGEESFRMKNGEKNVFVAGGVGVTPMLAQSAQLLLRNDAAGDNLRLVWSLRAEDIPLAVDSFERNKGLASVTKLFITGDAGASLVKQMEQLGATAEARRLGPTDLSNLKGRKFYLCASPVLLRNLNEWLAGEDVIWEDFGY